MNCCVAKGFCILEVAFDEMETLQVLQVTILSSFHMKYNQTLERLCFNAMYAAFWTKTTQCVCDVMTHLQWVEPISGIIKQERQPFQRIDSLGVSSEREPVLDSHP